MPRILLAAHGGESSIGAARLARLLRRHLGGDLDVVTVLPPLPLIDAGFGVLYAPSPESDAQVAAELARQTAAQLAGCEIEGCTPVVRHGPPAVEIAAAARSGRADLVVVGLGAHDLEARALGGETALQLVQVASTPVLAVPRDADRLPRRALVALDFTPTSVRAAETAARLLGDGGSLRLVHVRAPARRGAAPGTAEGEPADPDARLAEVAALVGAAAGVAVETAVLDGKPAATLLADAARHDVEMLALGSHGYGVWKRLTLGSVASKVLRLATTCVLVQPIGSLAAPVGTGATAPPGA